MIKAILFDLDGTLINTNNLIMQSFKYAFSKHLDVEVKEEEIATYFGEPLLKSMERHDANNAELMVNTFRQFNESKHDELAEAFEGVKEALEELKTSGFKLAVVTSKRRKMAERGLKLFNMLDYFDNVVTPEDTEKYKPDGEPASKACELLKVLPEESLMVGDSHNDILCGKNAGCKTCIVKYSILPLEELMKFKPDYIVDSLLDIIKLIKK